MDNYFYVVSGVIVLLALFENIIPNSTSGKSVKTVISVISVVVILSPIINVIKGIDNTVEVGINYNEYLQDYQNNLTETSIKFLLENEGCTPKSVEVLGEYLNGNYTVNKIVIKFENLVIMGETEHINIIEKIENLLATRLNILKAEIVIE